MTRDYRRPVVVMSGRVSALLAAVLHDTTRDHEVIIVPDPSAAQRRSVSSDPTVAFRTHLMPALDADAPVIITPQVFYPTFLSTPKAKQGNRAQRRERDRRR